MPETNTPHSYALVGAGGFAKEAEDLILALGGTVAVRVVEREYLGNADSQEVVPLDDLASGSCDGVVLGVGDVEARLRLFEQLRRDFLIPTLVHPTACVSPRASLGEGVLVMQNAVVNADAAVGDASLLNVACCVAHDCRVGRAVHLGPGVQMGGRSSVGDLAFCGTSATVLPDVCVGERSVCGAGAVVTRDVPPGVVVAGVPAVALTRGL
jgi:UDP-perosamine 4-acetyltransferase